MDRQRKANKPLFNYSGQQIDMYLNGWGSKFQKYGQKSREWERVMKPGEERNDAKLRSADDMFVNDMQGTGWIDPETLGSP